ncbi:hypothetical protein [Tardiphaga sp. 813_E8_N1_3]|uniref:hypothetical protein n=1 Tax=Tardiphaga sp. 813_E8_N1_3 TaxID=3240760 RepID=UPI003F1FDEDB
MRAILAIRSPNTAAMGSDDQRADRKVDANSSILDTEKAVEDMRENWRCDDGPMDEDENANRSIFVHRSGCRSGIGWPNCAMAATPLAIRLMITRCNGVRSPVPEVARMQDSSKAIDFESMSGRRMCSHRLWRH